MKRCNILLIIFAICVFSAKAQNANTLTLDQAIKLSLQNNKQLKLEQAKIKEATANLHQAKDNRLPDVNASGSYLWMDDPKVDLKLKLGSAPQQGSTQQESANPLASVKINSVAYGLATASLPLFSGFRIKYGIASQQYLLEATRLDADNNKEGVIANTILAYSNLYKAQLSAALIRENLNEAQKRVIDFTNQAKNGSLTHNDVLKAQLQEANKELLLMDANKNLDMAVLNMQLMLGLPDSVALVADSNSLSSYADTGNVATWVQNALQNRKDIMAMTAREQAANTNVKAIKGAYYPSLALTGDYIAANIPTLLSIDNALGIGIGLQYSLSSLWKTGGKIEAARAQQEQITINKELLADNVQVQVTEAYKDYVISLQKIGVYETALEESVENYKVTAAKYNNKVAISTDLLSADVAQLQAKMNYAFSKVDAVVAYDKLLQCTGVLVSRVNSK